MGDYKGFVFVLKSLAYLNSKRQKKKKRKNEVEKHLNSSIP